MIHNNEKKKKILFICTPFFGYYKHIIIELENLGYEVDYYNDRPTENGIVKGLIKIKKELVNNLIEKYFDDILAQSIKKKYDKVLIINGKIFNRKMIALLRKQQKNAEFIFYTWDSIQLYPNIKEFLNEFDRCYSFDLMDCENIRNLKFMPLFYTKVYQSIGDNDGYENFKYDILSICTVHPNRYELIKKLFPRLKNMGIKIYSFMYLNKLQFVYNKLFVNQFKRSKMKEFSFKSLSNEEIVQYIKESNVIFDIPHNKQTGLTMRTIESIGAKRKLITINKDIKKYDFYDENNILVLDNNDLDKIEDFINRDYKNVPDLIYKKYSITNWVNTLVNNLDQKYIK